MREIRVEFTDIPDFDARGGLVVNFDERSYRCEAFSVGQPEKRMVDFTAALEPNMNELLNYSFAELAPLGKTIRLHFDTSPFPIGLPIKKMDLVVTLRGKVRLLVAIGLELADWALPWSPRVYMALFKEISGAETEGELIILRHRPESPDIPLRETLLYLQAKIDQWANAIAGLLRANLRPDSLITYFNFPPSIRTACAQYLIYFVQFLKDLTGIEASAEVKEEAGKLLFSVTPTSGSEALSKIREALDVYLELPTARDLDVAAEQAPDFAALELLGEVHSLKSKLAYTLATVRAQERELEYLRLSNYRLQELLGDAATRPITLPHAEKRENEEPILDGLVKVTELELKGAKVDLPELFRRLKRKPHKDADEK